MITEILLFIVGLALLIGGGEYMVRGAVALSKRLSISPLVIGIVIVGFGTSVPELMASLFAVVKMNSPGLHFGNIIGSNIANVLLILGLTAVINPITFPAKPSKRDITFLILSVIFLWVAFFGLNEFGWRYGTFLMLAMAVYIFWSFLKRNAQAEEIPELTGLWANVFFSLFVTVCGIAVMVYGADIMVDNAVKIASDLGVSNTLIGLTIVAVGTSLPELTASLISAVHKRSDLAIGNIIGSNIFNAIFIPGFTAIANSIWNHKAIQISGDKLNMEFYVMAGVTVSFIFFSIRGRIGRVVGALFLVAYAAFIFFAAK
ncbi:calcium/sodium antiporter [bacterium]|nr:calcium/sodium antiporter [bacterium]